MIFDRDFWLQLGRMMWGSSLMKVGSSLAILGALALTGTAFETAVNAYFVSQGQAAPIPNVPPWIGMIILFTGAAMAVLDAYWKRPAAPAGPNPHDIALLESFRSQFPPARKEFLRDHDFGGSFHSQALDPVFEVAAWRGPDFEFTDNAAEALFATVKAQADEMAALAAVKTWPHRVAPNRHTALPDNHDEWAPAPETRQAIRELNSSAQALVQAIDEFERMARVRFPIT